jgi:hypothetical protein
MSDGWVMMNGDNVSVCTWRERESVVQYKGTDAEVMWKQQASVTN